MKISVQQALFHHLVQPVYRIASLAGINRRTAWNHVHAARNSHVKAWTSRPATEQDAAIKEAEQMVKGLPPVSRALVRVKPSQPVATNRARIPLGILNAMIDAETVRRVQANNIFTSYSITRLLRALNPDNEIKHDEVQARVRSLMANNTNYEMTFQNWNGEAARTWRPKQAQPAATAVLQSGHQPARLPSGIKIVDDD